MQVLYIAYHHIHPFEKLIWPRFVLTSNCDGFMRKAAPMIPVKPL